MVRMTPFLVDWLKSPARSRAVGTVSVKGKGDASFQCSYEVNVKSLFFMMGPPNVPPYIFRLVPRKFVSFAPAVRLSVGSVRALNLGLRQFAIAVPWYSFVPGFMFRTITPPAL